MTTSHRQFSQQKHHHHNTRNHDRDQKGKYRFSDKIFMIFKNRGEPKELTLHEIMQGLKYNFKTYYNNDDISFFIDAFSSFSLSNFNVNDDIFVFND